MWLFCLLDPFIPTQIKFLATPLHTAANFRQRRPPTGAQTFNAAPEFPHDGDFQPQILYFGGKCFRQEENFPTA